MENEYNFNGNLLTQYAETILGNIQRMEDIYPDLNVQPKTGHAISNQGLLLGFIFKYLLECQTEEEAIQYYREHRDEMEKDYMVERIIRRIQIDPEKIADVAGENFKTSPMKLLQMELHTFYNDEWDLDELKEFLAKNGRKSKFA